MSQKVTKHDEWSLSGQKERSIQDNKEEIMQKSIIKDIFGGVYKTEFTLDQSKRTDV